MQCKKDGCFESTFAAVPNKPLVPVSHTNDSSNIVELRQRIYHTSSIRLSWHPDEFVSMVNSNTNWIL